MSFDWSIFWSALFSWPFFEGALVTVALAVSAHAVGILIALGLAVAADAKALAIRWVVKAYVWLFRGAPTLLQLLFVWNALPQISPIFREDWFTPFIAALIALSLNEGAYQFEINRAALKAVGDGQRAAGMALGLGRLQIFLLIVLPQAMRVAIPPTANEFITLLKVTSLASVISLRELLTVTSQTVAVNFRFLELYAVALVYYLAIVSVLMILQARIEARLSRQDREAETAPGLPVMRLQPIRRS